MFIVCLPQAGWLLLQVWGTQSVLHFFNSNEPWKTYTRNGNFEFRQLQPGVELRLSEAVSVTAAAVPHRSEFSDAVGYYIKVRGAAAHVLHATNSAIYFQTLQELPIDDSRANIH
jgi:hypothetical protein